MVSKENERNDEFKQMLRYKITNEKKVKEEMEEEDVYFMIYKS